MDAKTAPQGVTIARDFTFRPLVVAPIANRVVRRAILEVLQGYGEDSDNPRRRWGGIPAIRKIMATRTSVGGIAERGVPHGMALIDDAIRAGKVWFVRSDIKNFFTRIPKAEIKTFILEAAHDDQFADLFEQALATNLANRMELEERHTFKLFPNAEVGVAQGSALSALAGNITLQNFDASMNGRGVVCIRYIDDFILLGPTESKVKAAYNSASGLLKEMGMAVYEPNDAKARQEDKVDAGNIHNGTNILGYRVSGASRQPSAAACRKFLERIDEVITDAKREMKAAIGGGSTTRVHGYHQAMVLLHDVVWGWSQAFRHTTALQVFQQLDEKIDKRIAGLEGDMLRLVPNGDVAARRRAMGVHLLVDTKKHLCQS